MRTSLTLSHSARCDGVPHFGIRNALLRHGRRKVLLTYPGLRLGNYLYFVLHAFLEARAGRDYRVLDTGLGSQWYETFPRLVDYTVQRPGPFDRREAIPELFYQRYGSDFNAADLTAFITSVLDTDLAPSSEDAIITVNVRRGDYYESSRRIATFGLDFGDYLRSALDLARSRAPVEAMRIVSDDNEWAASAVAQAAPELPIDEVIPGPPPNQLFALARSSRLILANSTFSYWGAYMSEVVHSPRGVDVYVPAHHARNLNGGEPWQHAPAWNAISTQPVSDG